MKGNDNPDPNCIAHLALNLVPNCIEVNDLLIFGLWIVLAHRVQERSLDHVQVLKDSKLARINAKIIYFGFETIKIQQQSLSS